MVLGGGQPAVAARQVVAVSDYAGDALALAPAGGGEAMDLCTTAWSSVDRQGASSGDRSLSTGESAVGLSADCGRAERSRHSRIGNHGPSRNRRGRWPGCSPNGWNRCAFSSAITIASSRTASMPYNGWRPHRSLGLAPPKGRTAASTWTGTESIMLRRRDRLGGLLHEYERAA